MGLFDKKFCDVCGEKIGLLGNRKLDDGNLCKDCAKKLSPWFEERRQSTVEGIKEQLAYREANKEKVRMFQTTRDFASDRYHVFIDDTKGQFAIATAMNPDVNPDILDLSQLISCRLEIKEEREEEHYEDKDGNERSYNPPRYHYSYDYWMKISVSTPWFDDMDFQLNTFSIEDHDRTKMMTMESLGNQIVAALTGTPYVQPMGMQGNMYGQQMGGMQGNMYGQPMNGMQGNMYSQQMNGMQGNMYGQQMGGMQGNMYGQQMNGMQGNMYGQPMGMQGQQMGGMQGNMYGQQMGQGGQMAGVAGVVGAMAAGMAGASQQGAAIRCSNCGWVPEDPNSIPRFCPECGNPF